MQSEIEFEIDWMNFKDRVEPALEALSAICGDRTKYGDVFANFGDTSTRWSQIMGQEVKPEEVCLMMIDAKLSREINGQHKRDNLVDIIGYACLYCELVDGKRGSVSAVPRSSGAI